MKYDISKTSAPKMPNLGRGTECIRILLSQASKDMHEPLVPMLFPILGAHVSGAEFQYPDLTWKEPCGMMANLVADSGCNKGQLSNLVEAICRDFRQHDDIEMKKLVEWSNSQIHNSQFIYKATQLFPQREQLGGSIFSFQSSTFSLKMVAEGHEELVAVVLDFHLIGIVVNLVDDNDLAGGGVKGAHVSPTVGKGLEVARLSGVLVSEVKAQFAEVVAHAEGQTVRGLPVGVVGG